MANIPLVNICITTYNREKYIAQAIESCMSQKTDFDFNIIISDDGSTDKTVHVVLELKNKYPDKIELLTVEKNQGLMANSIKILKATYAKYVALCDGDDYWIDDNKLQMQVDFLEKNPDFALCFTNSIILYELTGEQKVAKKNIWDVASTTDLISHNSLEGAKWGEDINSPGHTSSLVFRNVLNKDFPDWYYSCYMNDEILFLMLSGYGKAKFFNNNCSVYRVNPTGVSTDNFTFERDIKGRIEFYSNINEYFKGIYHKQLFNMNSRYYFKLFKIYKRDKSICKMVEAVIKCVIFFIKSKI